MHVWILVSLAAAGASALQTDLSSFGIEPLARGGAMPSVLVQDGEDDDDDKANDLVVAPIRCDAGMAVDTDGPPDGETIPDPDTHQDTTSATYDDGQETSISAFRVPYVVKPLGSRPGAGRCNSLLKPVKLWDFVRVGYGGRWMTAVVGDEGPPGKFGEGSLALHDMLGNERARENVGIGQGVTYVFYPNSGTRAKTERALLDALATWNPPILQIPAPRPRAQPRHRHRRRRRDR